RDMGIRGIQGPTVTIDQDQLKSINVAVGDSKGLGPLKTVSQAPLDWPIVLQGPKQEKLQKQMSEAVIKAGAGKLNATSYNEVRDGVDDILNDLKMQFREEKIDGGTYLSGKRFLDSLDQSVQTLREPAARKILNGSYVAKGHDVPELVDHMMRNGLKFA